MDDLFQYLIWGIIIFSFLSSFFKKKELPKQKTPLPKTKSTDSVSYQNQQSEVDRVAVSQKQDEYDILRELENLFKGEVNLPQQQRPKQTPYEEYAEHKIEDKNLETVSDRRILRNVDQNPSVEFRQSVEERNYIEPKGMVEQNKWTKKKSKIDPRVEASAKEFEKTLAGPRKQKATVTEFNRKLKNPRTVREYILFSEILGKPKALRR